MIRRNVTKKFYVYLILTIISCSFVFYAHSTGMTGKTLKSGTTGCDCHGASSTPGVTVSITGPDSLLPNETGTYMVTISGGPLVRGGTDIAASAGTLAPVTGSGLQLISGELTHTSPKLPSGGTVSFQFTYTAPASLGMQTLYANGNSVNFNGENTGDQWNFAPNKSVNVVATTPVELTSFIASANGNNVTLRWSTATETNNSGFTVERAVASGSETWETISFVKGAGSSSSLQQYSFEDRNLDAGVYSYRLRQVDFNGLYSIYNLAGKVEIAAPASFNLSQNYPNPFNPSTSIAYTLLQEGNVELKVYNSLGVEVASLINAVKPAGAYKISFDGKSLSSGVYYYKLSVVNPSGNNLMFSEVKKMILLK